VRRLGDDRGRLPLLREHQHLLLPLEALQKEAPPRLPDQ
jgi:hypothetical protein